jgi:Ferritin-like
MDQAARARLMRLAPGYRGRNRPGAGRIYSDPFLELIRLLTEAASLEHTLMISYIYAMFSLKEIYADVRGNVTSHLFMERRVGRDPGERGADSQLSFLDVAIEEMQHFSLVNQLLSDLGSAPNLMPHQFPMAADIYPFEIDLEPLSRKVVAKYLWIESDDLALSLHGPHKELARAVRDLLGGELPNHLGSVYRQILDVFHDVEVQPPNILRDLFPFDVWADRLRGIRNQGEIAHFNFFLRVFTGEAFGDGDIWCDPQTPAYPTMELRYGTAFRNYHDTIPDERPRRLAWLADLHYWLLLMLLDASYRKRQLSLRYKSIDGMTQCLWHLGLELAGHWGFGVPFDQQVQPYEPGGDEATSLRMVYRLAMEAQQFMRACDRDGLLPQTYDRTILPELSTSLGQSNVKHPNDALAD